MTLQENDRQTADLIGLYEVAKAFAVIGGQVGLFTREEAAADLTRRKEAGEIDEDEVAESLQLFDAQVEFTADHRVVTWMKLPDGVSDEDLREALASGEIKALRDGFFAAGETEWRADENGYSYNTHQHRELFGEEQSPWDPLAPDADGLLPFGTGTMLLRRI